MQIVSDIAEIKRITRRGQRRTVIRELDRRNWQYDIGHDGWPVVYLPDVDTLPGRQARPNWNAQRTRRARQSARS